MPVTVRALDFLFERQPENVLGNQGGQRIPKRRAAAVTLRVSRDDLERRAPDGPGRHLPAVSRGTHLIVQGELLEKQPFRTLDRLDDLSGLHVPGCLTEIVQPAPALIEATGL